jgi:hypothetical protein
MPFTKEGSIKTPGLTVFAGDTVGVQVPEQDASGVGGHRRVRRQRQLERALDEAVAQRQRLPLPRAI